MKTKIETLIIPAHDNESHNGIVYGRALPEFDESTRAVVKLRSEIHDMDLLLEYYNPTTLRCTHEDIPADLARIDMHITNGGQTVTVRSKNIATRLYEFVIISIDDSTGQIYPKGA